jgi:hypothetical protein
MIGKIVRICTHSTSTAALCQLIAPSPQFPLLRQVCVAYSTQTSHNDWRGALVGELESIAFPAGSAYKFFGAARPAAVLAFRKFMFARRFLLMAPLVLALAACGKPPTTADPRLEAPTGLADAAAKAGLRKPFVNPSVQAALDALGVQAAGPSTAEASSALADPSWWRKIDRSVRFDGVILAGPPAEYRALLAHLIDSPDWRLVHLDHWGVVFQRGEPRDLEIAPPAEAGASWPDAADRAVFLSQTASMLAAVARRDEARAYIEAAIEASDARADVLARAASIALLDRKWRDAAALSDRALGIDPKYVPALHARALALSGMKSTDDAWRVSEEIIRLAPSDPEMLLLHARLANAAKAFSREQASLERLVTLAEKHQWPSVNYRILLGQCYARQSLARPALEQFQAALEDPAISAPQRAEVEETIRTVRQRAGLTE